jgi:hypothetical protein
MNIKILNYQTKSEEYENNNNLLNNLINDKNIENTKLIQN